MCEQGTKVAIIEECAPGSQMKKAPPNIAELAKYIMEKKNHKKIEAALFSRKITV